MASAAVKKKIVVCGGNGFLGMRSSSYTDKNNAHTFVGSRICKAAVARDWDVTSIRYAPELSELSKY